MYRPFIQKYCGVPQSNKVRRSPIFVSFLLITIFIRPAFAGTPDLQFASHATIPNITINPDGMPVSISSYINFYSRDSIFSLRSEKGYLPSLVHNIGEQAASPFHFNGKDLAIAGASAGIAAVLIHYDYTIDEWFRTKKQQYPWVHKTSPVITQLGGTYGILTVASFGAISASLNDEKGVHTSLLATQSMITSGAWVRLLKLVTSRERPMASYIYNKSGGSSWHGPLAQYDQDRSLKRGNASFDSFPSGHTATAFSIATVFATEYSDIKIVPVISYSLATMVGVTRLTEHEHWASDVFVGGLIGYLCGREVVSHFNKLYPKVDRKTQQPDY